jgi:hypothetical protein
MESVLVINIRSLLMKSPLDYDGSQLRSHWIYQTTGLKGDAIVAFMGKADVHAHLVDLEDVQKNAFIYSEKMLHFLVEHFDTDLEKAVLRQRMLMVIVKEKIQSSTGILPVRADEGTGKMPVLLDSLRERVLCRVGDDLFIGDRKLSVSIATVSPVSTLIHVGLNISSKNTPVPAIGLDELIGEPAVPAFAETVMTAYREELQSIYNARCKVRGVS